MFGLVSNNGQGFSLKKYNTETYKYDIDTTEGNNIQILYSNKTLCSPRLDHETFSFVKLKQFDLDFYRMLLGTDITIKNNILAEFNGTNWNRL